MCVREGGGGARRCWGGKGAGNIFIYTLSGIFIYTLSGPHWSYGDRVLLRVRGCCRRASDVMTWSIIAPASAIFYCLQPCRRSRRLPLHTASAAAASSSAEAAETTDEAPPGSFTVFPVLRSCNVQLVNGHTTHIIETLYMRLWS
jgi:hypothetical protein